MPNPVVVGLVAAAVLLLVVRAAMAVRTSGAGMPIASEAASAGLVPRTRLGWWSIGLTLAYVLLLAAMQIVPGVHPFDSDPDLLTLTERLVFGATAGAAVVTGFVAVRRGDRSVLVYVAMALAAWVGLVPVLASFFFE